MKKVFLTMVLFSMLAACSSEAVAGSGSLEVVVMSEETITEGLEPGDEEENIRDGWTVSYTKFLANIGNFSASVSTSPENAVNDAALHVLDLTSVPSTGFELAHFHDMAATRWDRLGFQMPNASDASECGPGVDAADCATMKTEHLALWIAGTATRDSVTLTFDWKLPAGAGYADCVNSDGLSGIAITSGATQQAELTVHGDHWFFTRYPTGDESMTPISRCASWLEGADGADGTTPDQDITSAELMAFEATDAFPTGVDAGDCRYDLSSFPHAVNNAYDYVLQMARSLGHFQGEGDCETRTELN